MKQPSSASSSHLPDAFRRALEAYEICGFDTAAIRQWCIPELDAEMLVEATLQQRPKRILEVGTYVGVSTLLMALATDADTTIVTVDPNLPLATEMGSMHSDLGRLDSAARTHDVARAAARQLGFEERIRFIEGGFAIGDTFSSSRQDPNTRVPVVGPAICAEFGPFDLIFIDGLHYAAAVEADLRLAASALAPGGLVLMHDCIGMWGTNVRAGIFRFLASHPEYRLLHPTFSELYRSIGTVFRAEEHPDLVSAFRRSEPDPQAIRAAAGSVVPSAIRRLEPAFVLELGTGSVSSLIEMAGVPTVSVGVPSPADGQVFEASLQQAEAAWAGAQPEERLLISFGLLDHLSAETFRRFFEWLRERDGVALIGSTPPGETGVAGSSSRSFPQLVELVREFGLATAAWSNLDADPVEFAFGVGGAELATTSYCVNVALVGGKQRLSELQRRLRPQLILVDGPAAEAWEQQNLLRLHYSRGFAWTFGELAASQELVRRAQGETANLRDRLAEQERTSEDLRRQVREQLSRAASLIGEIEAQQKELAERWGVEADLRREIAAQLARSTDMDRVLGDYRAALHQRNEVEAELRRHFGDALARADDLVRQVLEHRDALEERDRANSDLRRQFVEQLARSEELAHQALEHQAAVGEHQQANSELQRQVAEQVARSEDLARQVEEFRTALETSERTSAELRSEVAEQVSRSKDLARQVEDYRTGVEIRERVNGDLRREVAEQVARSEDLARQIEEYRTVVEVWERANTDLRRQVAEHIARSDDLARQIHEYRAALEVRNRAEVDLRRQLKEQLDRSEHLVQQVLAYRAALENRDDAETALGRKQRQDVGG
jgi:predicted O-methyltransferase YrrM